MAESRYPLDEIRARCDLVEVVSPHVALKRSGKTLKGLCPFHTEKTPSFIVNRDTQRWMCFGCGLNGDVFSFLMRVEGLTFPEAVEQLAEKSGVSIERTARDERSTGERDLVLRVNKLATFYFRRALQASESTKEYLRGRGVTAEAVEQFKLGFAPAEWRGLADYLRSQGVKPEDAAKAGLILPSERGSGFYDRFRNRLIFPIQDVQDRVIAFGGRALAEGDVKYINSPETRAFVKNRTLYALNLARKAIIEQDCVILVEGYMDALTAQSAGFANVVATMGTALTTEHVNLLSRYTHTAVLAYDADSAGMKAAIRGGPMFEEADFEVRVAGMPQGEDPDSLIRRGDRALFAELIASAAPIPDYRLGAIVAKFDMGTSEGQLAMLKEAVSVVAEVGRQVERERLIAWLAPRHPNYGTGTAPAQDHIRREVNARRARMHKDPEPRRAAHAASANVDFLSEEGKAVRKAERELLGKILCLGLSPEELFSEIDPGSLVGEDASTLAAALLEEYRNAGKINLDAVTARLDGTSGETLLNELLVSGVESDETPVSDLIGAIRTYHKKEQEKRFRTLAERIQRGEIGRADKEFSEYWQLVRELHT